MNLIKWKNLPFYCFSFCQSFHTSRPQTILAGLSFTVNLFLTLPMMCSSKSTSSANVIRPAQEKQWIKYCRHTKFLGCTGTEYLVIKSRIDGKYAAKKFKKRVHSCLSWRTIYASLESVKMSLFPVIPVYCIHYTCRWKNNQIFGLWPHAKSLPLTGTFFKKSIAMSTVTANCWGYWILER